MSKQVVTVIDMSSCPVILRL